MPNGCIHWTSGKSGPGIGYGVMTYQKQHLRASHVSYELFVGEIPDGLFVLHRCDNSICVNPVHLFLGTDKDNADDKVAKGRCPRGEQMTQSKLTEAAVIEIRRRREQGETLKALALEFGVTFQLISRVVLRKIWKHI
jgi:hypothetical protein